jgi:hypothetical protein
MASVMMTYSKQWISTEFNVHEQPCMQGSGVSACFSARVLLGSQQTPHFTCFGYYTNETSPVWGANETSTAD